ncbi:MAG: hypothetical protein PWQ57_878 [Desulfovibrionales bacterium]|nr:hypothetical protein [Desulfovibrionales bacterium]
MSRQPIDQQAQQPRGQERYWAAVRELRDEGAPITTVAVHGRSNGAFGSVSDYVRRLELAGYLERVGATEAGVILYRLAKDSVYAPRVRKDGSIVPPTKREHMWRALKMLGTVSILDLVACASTEQIEVKLVDAQDYVRHLARAGYLARVKGSSPARWRLIRYTGPRPPAVQRVKQIWDPNLKEVVWRANQEADYAG